MVTITTITIPKIEYEILRKKAEHYEHIRKMMEKDIFTPPPTKKISEVLTAFRKTKRYNNAFIKSLEVGLRRSSYFCS